MSEVTSVILISGDAYDTSKIERLQEWLDDHEHGHLVRIPGRDEGAEQPGDRYLEQCVWYAGLNYLDFPAFLRAVADCGWRDPEQISILADPKETLIPGLYRLTPELTWIEAAAPQWYSTSGDALEDVPQLE